MVSTHQTVNDALTQYVGIKRNLISEVYGATGLYPAHSVYVCLLSVGTKFRKPCPTCLLFTSIRRNTNGNFRTVAILLFYTLQKCYLFRRSALSKMCHLVSFRDLDVIVASVAAATYFARQPFVVVIVVVVVVVVAVAVDCKIPEYTVYSSIYSNIQYIPNYSQQDATFLCLFIFTNALHVSGGSSGHYQEHTTVHTASGTVNKYFC